MKTPAAKALCAASRFACTAPATAAARALRDPGSRTRGCHSSSQPAGGTADSGLIAHEWGTFTAIAGADGQPVEWLPVDLVGKPEFPTFVEHFRGFPKSVLRGTVRMETPVIYFYAPQETSVSVRVSFSKGFITEWYPHASRLQPSTPLASDALYKPHDDGNIAWDSITVAPNLSADFAREIAASRYYAARETSATPLSVLAPAGQQHEKFLFYRGVSTVSLPLSAKVLPTGGILFDNQAGQPIPALIVFERRGNKLGYHIVNSPSDHVILETPAVSGTFESLRADLEDILASQGLYRDEAHAMLETWGDSWFEEGSRLIYIVPRAYARLDSSSLDQSCSHSARAGLRRPHRAHHSGHRKLHRGRHRLSRRRHARKVRPISLSHLQCHRRQAARSRRIRPHVRRTRRCPRREPVEQSLTNGRRISTRSFYAYAAPRLDPQRPCRYN